MGLSKRQVSIRIISLEGRLVAQAVKRPALDFSSGHDLMVRSSPVWGSVLFAGSLLGILFLSLCPSPAHSLSLSLSK